MVEEQDDILKEIDNILYSKLISIINSHKNDHVRYPPSLFPLTLEVSIKESDKKVLFETCRAYLTYQPHYELSMLDIVFHAGYLPLSYSITDYPDFMRMSVIQGIKFTTSNWDNTHRIISPQQMRMFWNNVGLEKELLRI